MTEYMEGVFDLIITEFKNSSEMLIDEFIKNHNNFIVECDNEGSIEVENVKSKLNFRIEEIINNMKKDIKEIETIIEKTKLSRQTDKALKNSKKEGIFSNDKKRIASKKKFLYNFKQLREMIIKESNKYAENNIEAIKESLEFSYTELIEIEKKSRVNIRNRKEYLNKLRDIYILYKITHNIEIDIYDYSCDNIDLEVFDNSKSEFNEYVSANEMWMLNNSIDIWEIWDLEQVRRFYNNKLDREKDNAHDVGKYIGYSQGHVDGYSVGYSEGHSDGYREGHEEGYDEGYYQGSSRS